MGTNRQQVLFDINLSIMPGELIAIMGASGSGKSTIMNIIGLLDKPSTGSCIVQGESTSSLAEDSLASLRNKLIGFVFQQFFLLPKLNALQNVALPLLYRGYSDAKSKQQAMDILARVNMQDRYHHKPNELSGGQQQRVAIARALVGSPEVILADEPTGALDSSTGAEVMSLFKELNRVDNRTVIIVTHDPLIGEQCDRVIKLKDGHIV